jgi:hypothetical protein
MGRRRVAGNVWGRWRITGMDLWDRDAVELLGPAGIDIRPDGTGEMRFIAVEADLDHRELVRDGRPGVDFSWDGHDDGSPVSGRGWLVLSDDADLRGHIWFHKGDDSGFEAHLIGGDDSATT